MRLWGKIPWPIVRCVKRLAKCRSQRRSQPRGGGSTWRLLLPVGSILQRHRNFEDRRRRRIGPILFGPSLTLPAEQYDQAIEAYQAAARAGYDSDTCALARAEALRVMRKPEAHWKCSINCPAQSNKPRNICINAAPRFRRLSGSPAEVVALFERAVAVDPKHIGRCSVWRWKTIATVTTIPPSICTNASVARYPAHVGSLLNLGILYEDRTLYDRAYGCYQRMLDVFPNHPRARLYVKDVNASRDMFYDEDEKRRRDRLSQVMSVPVTDFELSVRSRNCLQKMGVMTLGDLARTTEAELLASKNFGETSLVEIREMMDAKGLALGMFAKETLPAEPVYEPEIVTPDEAALLDRPITDLNLSVRARKCMVRLGINTIGELVRRTGDDLLECKNFGVTSLTEVREKLTIKNLKLRGD